METIISSISHSFTWNSGGLIHLATLGYVMGLLFKNQMVLRVLVFIATTIYIIYYYAFPVEPLWGAILGAALIMIANTTGLLFLLYDRFPLRISPEHMRVYASLKGLQPGEFRRLMKLSELITADQDTQLTVHNEQPDALFFVIKGNPLASKGAHHFTIPSSKFIGEVSFILNGPASASVTLPKGGQYLRWNREPLIIALTKSHSLKQAFEALIGRDLASKVAISEPIN
ncbi:MAG: hypothetical protein ACI9J2_000490 [Saprospiraceae bacterium]|jgi:hypothetical protein